MIKRVEFSGRFVLRIAMVAGVLLSSGCGTLRKADIPDWRDLSVLESGASRTRVIAVLGTPVWTQESEDSTTDVFTFKQGYRRGVQALRTLGLATGDLLLLGAKHAETSDAIAAGTEMKIQVVYDEHHNVASVRVLEGEEIRPESEAPFPKFAKKSGKGLRGWDRLAGKARRST